MKTTSLPAELEAQLRKDLRAITMKIEEILLIGKANHPVEVAEYTKPTLDESRTVPKTDPSGALVHYHRVRNVLEYIFEHDGKIKEKYRRMLNEIRAPNYLISLLEESIDVDRSVT